MKEVLRQISLSKEESGIKLRVSFSQEENYDKQGFINKILKYQKPKLFRSFILKSDYIIIDLLNTLHIDRELSLLEQSFRSKKDETK
jgi:hypothetical protein